MRDTVTDTKNLALSHAMAQLLYRYAVDYHDDHHRRSAAPVAFEECQSARCVEARVLIDASDGLYAAEDVYRATEEFWPVEREEEQRQAEQALRKKRARRIIDVVIGSPCIVETRFFSQPEEQDKLESQVAALLGQLEREQLENEIFQDATDANFAITPPATPVVAREAAMRAAKEIAQQVIEILNTEYPNIKWPRGTIRSIAFDSITKHFAATTSPSETAVGREAQKCVKCGHGWNPNWIDAATGLCMRVDRQRSYSKLACNCKCEFAAPVRAAGDDEGKV